MEFQKAPNINGRMELTENQRKDIKTKLEFILENFTPTVIDPVCNVHFLVSNYNAENELKINGDTAEHLLDSILN